MVQLNFRVDENAELGRSRIKQTLTPRLPWLTLSVAADVIIAVAAIWFFFGAR